MVVNRGMEKAEANAITMVAAVEEAEEAIPTTTMVAEVMATPMEAEEVDEVTTIKFIKVC